jgi:hypothetical protein
MVTVTGTGSVDTGGRWHRGSHDPRSVQERWIEVARAYQKAGFGPGLTPQTDQNIYNMQQEMLRARPVTPPDPAHIAASAALTDLKARRRRAVVEVDEMRRRVASARQDWVHKLLADLPAVPEDLAAEIPDHSDWRSSTRDIQQIAERALPQLLQVEGLRDSLKMALSVRERDPAALSLQLVEKLFAYHQALAREAVKNATLATQVINALQERIDNLESQVTRLGHNMRRRNRNAKERATS